MDSRRQAEAQLLKLLAQFGKVQSALDVGTFTGYSALALAEALPENGKVVTLEREAKVAEIAAAHFLASPHGGKIEQRVGAAADGLAALIAEGASFDLAFVDADKPGYKAYYDLLMDGGLLKVGGLLVLDNTMYKAEELMDGELSANGAGVRAVNEAVAADARVERVMLPLRDGVTLVYRKA